MLKFTKKSHLKETEQGFTEDHEKKVEFTESETIQDLHVNESIEETQEENTKQPIDTNIALTKLPREINTEILMTEEIEQLLNSSSVAQPTNTKATVTCSYFAANATDISVKKNDAVRIIYKESDYVYVRNKKGVNGFIPFSYCLVASKKKSNKTENNSHKKSKNSECENENEDILNGNNKNNEATKEEHLLSNKDENENIKNVTADDKPLSNDYNNKLDSSESKVGVTEKIENEIEEAKNEIPSSIYHKVIDTEQILCNDKNNNTEQTKIDIASGSKEDTADMVSNITSNQEVLQTSKMTVQENDLLRTSDVGSSVSSSHQSIDQLYNGDIAPSIPDSSEISRADPDLKKSKSRRKMSSKHFSWKNLLKKKKKKTKHEEIQNINNVVVISKMERWSGSQVDWYSDLFKEDVSDSSESEEETLSTTDTDFTKNSTDVDTRTFLNFDHEQILTRNVRRRESGTSASSDFYIPKKKIESNQTTNVNSMKRTNQSSPQEHVSKKMVEPKNKTTSGFATIHKTDALSYYPMQDDFRKSTLSPISNSLNEKRMSGGSSSLRMSSNSKKKDRWDYFSDVEDILHSPLVPRKITSPIPIENTHIAIQGNEMLQHTSNHGRRTPLLPIDYNLRTKNTMLVSYDFIATDENDATILTGHHVEVLKKPDKDWWWIRTTDGREGFVPQTFLAPIPTVPSRKPDLLEKLHYVDVVSSEQENIQYRGRNPVQLPSRHVAMESSKLAKVAPFYQEEAIQENIPDNFHLYKKQVQEIQKARPPPPSYTQHVMHKQHVELMDSFYNSPYKEEPIQAATKKDWNSHENTQYIEPSSTPPRVVRRKSFSGRQKRVRFSNDLDPGYASNPGHIMVIKQYGLDLSVHGEEESEISTWC